MSSHYFDAEPAAPMTTRQVEFTLDGKPLALVSARGVFGWERLDQGTRSLIGHAPAPPAEGNLLDLGCGYGPVAVALALRAPAATVWAVDVNRRATALTSENARRVGAANIRAGQPEDVPGEVMFDAIYSNPPIRVGKESLHDLLGRWLPRLRPGGHAYLVVKRSLGADTLDRWLNAQGWATRRLRSKSGYRIFEVDARTRTRPSSHPGGPPADGAPSQGADGTACQGKGASVRL